MMALFKTKRLFMVYPYHKEALYVLQNMAYG